MYKEDIAIVGIGCQTPGKIHGPESFWNKLMEGVDGITEVPKDRWNHEEYYDPNPNKAGKIKTKKGGFLERVDLFDNEFFKVFPKEAERIDPQQRLLLQTTFEAIEDAGDKLADVRGSNMAVFMSVFTNDYWDMQIEQDSKFAISPHVAMGASRTAISNRISYFYDLKGPSVSVDTACSGALVAVHLACHSIWDQSATSAMAGGVNVIINPESTMMMSKGNFLSPDGYCKSFDERANGYVRGEGVGVVYLKPLSQALKDKNNIYGLIKATACNSDGNTVEGFTVPSETSQTAMLKQAYKAANVDVDKLQYIEAHGTGTPVGDPIETKSFSNVFGQRDPSSPLMIGSVKTNIGHLEGAAGVAGLIKLALSMKNKKIPGNLHFQKVNPKIDLEGWRLKVVSENTDWPAQKDGGPRVGGVNSFGAGGTNAHLVLQEYIPEATNGNTFAPEENMYLFHTSAMTSLALNNLLIEYKSLISSGKYSLRSICYNVGKHRSDLKHRIAIAGTDAADIVAKIDAYLEDNILAGVTVNEVDTPATKVAFVFTGQGPQWYAMGQELIASEPLFKSTIQKIESHFSKIAGWSLLDEMNKDEASTNINDTRIAQPAIMAIQIALVELWKKHGVTPEGVVGHSIGEVAAAYASGALTLEQAVSVIFHRSRGQHAATGKGKMLAVSLKLAEAEEMIKEVKDVVSIGAVNGPEMCVLSGDEEPLIKISEELTNRDIFNKFLRVTVPFHSHHMEPLKEELISSLKDLVPAKAKTELYSTVTGEKADGTHLVSEYWYDNVREPVYFSNALEKMVEDGYDFFIEIGPHPALSAGAEELFASKESNAVIFPSIKRKENEKLRFLQTLGSIYTSGLALDWDSIYPGESRIYDLPRYQWDLKSFWHEPARHKAIRLNKKIHPLIQRQNLSGLGGTNFSFDLLLDRRVDPYIDDHRVDDAIIFPGTGHLEIATSAAMAAFGESFSFLEDINFESALFLPEEGELAEAKIEVFSDEGQYWILSKDPNKEEAQWVKNSRGKMNMLGDQFVSRPVVLEEIKNRVNDRLPVQPMYLELKRCGLQYGPSFKLIKNLYVVADEILAKIDLHESLTYHVDDYNLHPAVLDACLQSMFAAKMSDDDEERGIYLPTHIDRYKFHGKPTSESVYSYIQVEEASSQYLRGDFWILNEDGSLICEIQGIDFKYIEGSRKQEDDVAYSGCFEFEWEEIETEKVEKSDNTILMIRENDFEIEKLNQKLSENNATLIHTMISDYSDRELVRTELKKVKEMNPKLNRAIITLPITATSDDLGANAVDMSWKILNVFNAIIMEELEFPIWIINQNAEIVLDTDKEINLAQAPTYGLARVMYNEYPMVTCKIADLSDINSAEETANLANMISSPSNGGAESDLAFRGSKVYSKRLQTVNKEHAQGEASAEQAASGSLYRSTLLEDGSIDSIAFKQIAPFELAENEVEIEVKAAGLNTKDLWNIHGSLPKESVEGGLVGEQIGMECSGIVSQVGSQVKNVKVGDAVVAYASQSFAGKTVTPQHCVVKKPEHLSFQEASGLSVAYLTAYYCMFHLAQMEAGERILIHNATDDAGLAAIALAQLRGVEVFATAPTEEKRTFLKGLKIDHVYDSGNGFYDHIMSDTYKEGVDLVLNTLSGQAIVQSLKSLRPFGRFVELGKTDIYNDINIHLKRFGNNLSYSAVDIDRLMAQKPTKAQKLYEEVIQLFDTKELAPLPLQSFSINEIGQAFEVLTKEDRMGKVVVSMEDESVLALPADKIQFSADKSYIITGGASGFGIEIAKWMADRGAKNLALVSRSGPKNDYDYSWISKMKQNGVDIMIENLDLSKLDQVRNMTQRVNEHAPIGGVIHGAAILQDATISRMDKDLFKKVFIPKAIGAWNLHLATESIELEHFMMFSSVSSVVGVPGQSNYSSANNFLDKLVSYRKLKGLSAQSINLGVLGQYAGMTKDGNGTVLNVLDSQGWIPLTLKQILSKLEKLMLEGDRVRMATNVDWLKFRDFFQHLRSDGKFAHLLTDEVLKVGSSKGGGEGLREQLLAADDQASTILVDSLKGSLARILGTTPDKLNESKSISAIGLDSLMMNQLRNWMLQKIEYNYPLMKLSKGPSIMEISDHILAALKSEAVSDTPAAVEDESGITSEEDIEVINEWFVHKKRDESETADKIKLFMFHSMGAGASMFDHFLYNLPEGTDVYAVQMPGRENRINEELYTDFTKLMDDMESEIVPLLDRPFAFFGHSFGGIVAFELSRRLRSKYGKEPEHFYCSGTMAPQMTVTWKNRDVLKQSSISSNSEQKLLGLMSYIDDINYVKKILPRLRLDMALLTSYDFVEEEKFEFPITVFSAIEDEVTLPEEMRPWEYLTNGQFKQELVHGDHWFVSRNKVFISDKISEDLKVKQTVNVNA